MGIPVNSTWADVPRWTDFTVLPRPGDPRLAAAIEALSTDHMRILLRRALRMLSPKARQFYVSQDQAMDLLHAAILNTLNGRRQWNPEVDLVHHLTWAMHSIADGWSEKEYRHTAMSDVHESKVRWQAEVEARITIQKLQRSLKGDRLAQAVLETLERQCTAPEAQKELNISCGVYMAARKRIQRRARRLNSLQGMKRA